MTWSCSSVTSSTVPNNGFGSQPPTIPSVAKRIQEEWKILEKDLPVTILVRAYQTRMDRVRAVIVGAEATPYHDGLFFFDVCFPSDYPNVPPAEPDTDEVFAQVTLLPEANRGLIDSDALTHKRNAKSTTPFKSDHWIGMWLFRPLRLLCVWQSVCCIIWSQKPSFGNLTSMGR